MLPRRVRRRLVVAALVAVGLAVVARPVLAHGGSLRLGAAPPPVPFWLVSLTGGAVIGGSFLFTTLLTDDDLIDAIAGWRVRLDVGVGRVVEAGVGVGRAVGPAVGVGALLTVVAVGLFGPQSSTANLAILVVWVVWWAGFTATTYLVGNTWPAVNPWRAVASRLPRRGRPLPTWTRWASALALLGLVFLEVVSPLSADPRILALVVVGYTVVTVVGATRYDDWFERVDPASRVFALYGRVAPVRVERGSPVFSLPGGGLVGRGADEVFVVALLWATTFDGLVSTAGWAGAVRALVGVGVPPLLVYGGGLLAGFGLFLGAYRLACLAARRTGETYVSVETLGSRFAPSLLPIAAGYHLAHYLGYLLTYVPTLGSVLSNPLAPPAVPPTLVLPDLFGVVPILAIIGGHLLAVGVAHVVAFDLFTGRLQPLRSQYPFVVVMITYTAISLWLVSQQTVQPPFVT